VSSAIHSVPSMWYPTVPGAEGVRSHPLPGGKGPTVFGPIPRPRAGTVGIDVLVADALMKASCRLRDAADRRRVGRTTPPRGELASTVRVGDVPGVRVDVEHLVCPWFAGTRPSASEREAAIVSARAHQGGLEAPRAQGDRDDGGAMVAPAVTTRGVPAGCRLRILRPR
jgi:hypothetical protein